MPTPPGNPPVTESPPGIPTASPVVPWSSYDDIPDGASLPFLQICRPTDVWFANVPTGMADPLPFVDPYDMFSQCRAAAATLVEEGSGTNLFEVIQNAMVNSFDKSRANTSNDADARALALRLAKTPPTIFGQCFKMDDEAQLAHFKFSAFPGSTPEGQPVEAAIERYDMVMWFSALHILGKLFDVDGWTTVTSTNVDLPVPDPTEIVMNVKIGNTNHAVSRMAKKSMEDAVHATSNRPTIFFRAKHAVQSAANILGIDWLEWSFPHTKDELLNFDWTAVNSKDPKSFPRPVQPTNEQFEIIRTVYQEIKSEQDAIARKLGMPKSGVQSYTTFVARLRQWFVFSVVFRYIEPTLDMATVEAKMMGCIKLCSSGDKIMTTLETLMDSRIKAVQSRIYAKKAHDKMLAAAAKADEEAKKAAEEKAAAAEEKKRCEQQKVSIQAKKFPGKKCTAQKKRVEETKRADAGAKEAEKKLAVAVEKEKKAKAVSVTLKKKAADRYKPNSLVRTLQIPMGPQKKAARKDFTALDLVDTPRTKAEKLGEEWNPPRRSKESVATKVVYDPPGEKWKEEQSNKLRLLIGLRGMLTTEGMIGPPMSFTSVMEYISVDDRCNVGFNGKVFLYLVALMLREWW